MYRNPSWRLMFGLKPLYAKQFSYCDFWDLSIFSFNFIIASYYTPSCLLFPKYLNIFTGPFFKIYRHIEISSFFTVFFNKCFYFKPRWSLYFKLPSIKQKQKRCLVFFKILYYNNSHCANENKRRKGCINPFFLLK